MEKSLDALVEGVKVGRKYFANTMQYIFMVTNANFGICSAWIEHPFPAFSSPLRTQILLTNLLTDLPEMTIATDTIDKELVEELHSWDINFIRKFVMVFGFTSSFFIN